MDMQDFILDLLEIEDYSDFRYFEQFAALMETPADIDRDSLQDLVFTPAAEDLKLMTSDFFEDLIKGVPDDNMNLYSAIQEIREPMIAMAGSPHLSVRGFFVDELARFREWYLEADRIECRAEGSDTVVKLSPCEAMMLFREEKLSGRRYSYDFTSFMPEPVDEYAIVRMQEMNESEAGGFMAGSDNYDSFDSYDSYDSYSGRRSYDDYDGYGSDMEDDEYGALPLELPRDFDINSYDPEDSSIYDRPIDPYEDGLIDRYHPVIVGEGIDELC